MSVTEPEQELFVAENVQKYELAGRVAREAVNAVLAACETGANIAELCALGDRIVEEAGDLVKVEVGAHIDGFPALLGETRVVGGGEPMHEQGAAVSLATYVAAHAVQRLLRPGVTNTAISEACDGIARHFGVRCVRANVSYELKRYVTDGFKQILMSRRAPTDEPLECGEFALESGQAFCVDVRMTSGGGELKRSRYATNVYKRLIDVNRTLKNPSGIKTMRDINNRFPTFHFAVRQLRDQKLARLGMKQVVSYGMVEPLDVLVDRERNACFACARFTSLILDQRTPMVAPLDAPALDGVALPPALVALLSRDAERHEAGIETALFARPDDEMAEDD